MASRSISILVTRYPARSTTPPIAITDNGTPIGASGRPMVYRGYCRDRQRLKWRCPAKAGRQAERSAYRLYVRHEVA